MRESKRLLISGRVQGVFFRANTARVATGLGLDGWVRNLVDGRVEALVQGKQEVVQELIAWCHNGPRLARVDHLEIIATEVDPELEGRGFDVRCLGE